MLIKVLIGTAGVLTGHPLDTVRIRQQTEAQNVYRCCSSIIRNEGILGFFKGQKFCLSQTTFAMVSLFFYLRAIIRE